MFHHAMPCLGLNSLRSSCPDTTWTPKQTNDPANRPAVGGMLDHIRLSSWYVPTVDFWNPRGYLVGGFNPVEKYYCSQNGNLPQVGVKIKNIGNHLDMFEVSWISWMAVFQMSYSTFCKVSYSWLSILDFRAFQKRIPPMLPTNLSIVYYLGGWHAFFSNLEIPLEKKTKPFWMGLGTKLHPQALPGRWMELPEIGMAQLLHSFFVYDAYMNFAFDFFSATRCWAEQHAKHLSIYV